MKKVVISTVVEGSILVVTAIWSIVPTVATETSTSFPLFALNEKSKEFSSTKNFLKGINCSELRINKFNKLMYLFT